MDAPTDLNRPRPRQRVSPLRVLEFYSGIGGMHYALQASGINAEVIGAVDINDLANKVYRHNFPDTNLMQRSIEGITEREFIKFDADMLLMSPPCQPFTRQGLKGDNTDARTRSFFYVLDTLPRLPKTPTYILVENVKGFETSNTRDYLVQTLKKCNFSFEEFLLSPVHLGIPNQRLRYFLLAKKLPLEFVHASCVAPFYMLHDHRINLGSSCHHEQNLSSAANVVTVMEHSQKSKANSQRTNSVETNTIKTVSNSCNVPTTATSDGKHLSAISQSSSSRIEDLTHSAERMRTTEPLETELACSKLDGRINSTFVLDRTIIDYLEDLGEDDITKYLIPDKVLVRYGRLMDIVTSADERTMCFTKGYGHKAEGSGSVLQTNIDANRAEAFSVVPQDTKAEAPPAVVEKLRCLRLRYFTPREIARLHHLPEEFSFPSDVTVKQCYRVLGNSLNAYVVSALLQYLVL